MLVALAQHEWPGNVRELKAVIERAVLLSRGGQLGSRHLAFAQPEAPRASVQRPVAAAAIEPSPAVEDLSFLTEDERADRAAVIAALELCAGNQTRAAKQLGLARTTLVNKLRLYRIPRPRT